MRNILGDVRLRSVSGSPVFLGIGPSAAVDQYLGTASRQVRASFGPGWSGFAFTSSGKPAGAPLSQDFWAAKATGSGVQTLTWTPRNGDWRLVLMNADAAPGVRARLAVGGEFPALLSLSIGTLAIGVLLLLLGETGLYLAVRRRS